MARMTASTRILYCLLLLCALSYLPRIHAQVISCGGFVKSSNSDVFSKIKIKLENTEGVVKFESDVNPSNGDWMLPVYNKGAYVIKIEGPDGFVFNPPQIPLTINGKDDACTKSEDINFVLFGYTVSGKVRSGNLAGPSRLNLALYSEDNKLYASTFTDETGAYAFEASPGKYTVSTIDNTQQCVERGSVAVEVKDKPVVVVPDIRISGHSLVVSVVGDSNEALNSATVLLVSDQKIPFDQQINAPKPSASQKNSKWEYRLLTDKSGKAVFTCLPPNKYELSTSWSTKKTSLSFLPSKHNIVIASEIVEVAFKTEGFDVDGQVQIGQKPLDGVSIFVDGKQAAKTDNNGNYKIKALKHGRHVVEAKKEHFYFDKLTHEISIENPTLPVIKVKKLEVCGFVKFDSTGDKVNHDTQMNVLDSRGSLIEKLHIDKKGKFCSFLQQGSYKVEPANRESRIKPDFLSVEVLNEPVLDLIFTEFKATINGQLKCFSQTECSNAKVHLLLSGKEVDSVSLQGNSFVFKDVLPGNYKLHLAELDSICVDDEKKSITVESTNLDVVFKQTGYKAELQSPIDAKLNWKHGSESGTQTLSAGQNSFCLPQSGTYTFNFDTCHEFAQGRTLTHTLPSKERLSLTVKSSQFTSSIQTDINASPNDFKLQLKSSQGETILTPAQNSQAKNFIFNTHIDNELVGQEIMLTPKSDKFLFKPTQHTWNFNGECSSNRHTFKAIEGRFVMGVVEPAVSDVKVIAKHKSDGTILTSRTDSKGSYKIGLVFDPNDYDVEFDLEGYKFSPTSTKNKFKSTKLSKLIVAYADKATKKELADVLISLSGNSYRENKIVNPNGQITFVGLPAGEYFIRSVLREYQFDPVTTSVKINEGETVEVKLLGNRYAYSAFGKVSTAGGGSPSSQMNVEAISQNCGKLQEEDPTDEKGNFRIRGLKPKCTYRLSLRSNDGTQISSIPPFIDINTEEKDTTDLEFTILATVPLNEIVGIVHFVDVTRPKTVRVELYENGVFKTHEDLTTNSVFIFSNVITTSNTYRLVINDAELKNLNAFAEPVEFVATQLTKNVILNVGVREKRPEIETSKSNVFGVIFVILSAFICINVNYSKDLLLTIIDRTRAVINQQRETSPGADKRRKAKRN